MKSKTFIERKYEQMKKANVVRSSEDFSTDYLGKSKSYYRTMESQGLEANTAMLTRLANELHTRRVLFKKSRERTDCISLRQMASIEEEVTEELVLRATDNGSINTFALHSVLSAIQVQITQRQSLTV